MTGRIIGVPLFDILMEFHRLDLIWLADALDSEIFTGIFADHKLFAMLEMKYDFRLSKDGETEVTR